MAFADRTPGISRYYEHRVMAAREAERTGMPIEEADASEVWEAYNSVRAESYCPRCGKRLGPQKTMGSGWQITITRSASDCCRGDGELHSGATAGLKDRPQGTHHSLAALPRRTGEGLKVVSELFQQIRRFLTLIGRERRLRSHLILVKVGFYRDYRIALGPNRSLAQPSELASCGAEQAGNFAQVIGHRGQPTYRLSWNPSRRTNHSHSSADTYLNSADGIH
jgi:hypothetical protein